MFTRENKGTIISFQYRWRFFKVTITNEGFGGFQLTDDRRNEHNLDKLLETWTGNRFAEKLSFIINSSSEWGTRKRR